MSIAIPAASPLNSGMFIGCWADDMPIADKQAIKIPSDFLAIQARRFYRFIKLLLLYSRKRKKTKTNRKSAHHCGVTDTILSLFTPI
jgi:hypothetical protein